MEPVQCSSSNAWAQAFDPASYERSQYRLLKVRLETDMNNELDIRGRNHVRSSVVTLIDLGIKWKIRGAGNILYNDYPGLGLLAQNFPDIVHNKGNTKVAEILAFITSNNLS